jgi:hypothetical protein
VSYPEELLDPYSDDGTMVESKEALAQTVVGHKIVAAEKRDDLQDSWYNTTGLLLTLDDGRQVQMREVSDCCAYTEVEAFLLNPELVDHVITGVGTTDGYNTWHIYADAGDVLELTVGWSCGNPFYYGYGFAIQVVGEEENEES